LEKLSKTVELQSRNYNADYLSFVVYLPVSYEWFSVIYVKTNEMMWNTVLKLEIVEL